MIDFDFSTALLAVLFFIPLLAFLRLRWKMDWVPLIFVAVFCVYLTGMASQVFFPIWVMRNGLGPWSYINLTPFLGLTPHEWKGALLNVALFMPFGFWLPFLREADGKRTVLSGLIFSLGIETAQLLLGLSLGFGARRADINDLAFNTFGTALGYGCFRLAALGLQKALSGDGVRPNALLGYLHMRTEALTLKPADKSGASAP